MPTARRRSEMALAALGKETALDTARRLEAAGNQLAARALRQWSREDMERVASLVACLPASSGRRSERRELRVAMCGVSFLARRGTTVGFARRGCKDRVCPTCGHRRRQRFVHALRRIVADREVVRSPGADRCEVEDDDSAVQQLAALGLQPAENSRAPRPDFQGPELTPGVPEHGCDADLGDGFVRTCRAPQRGAFVERRRLLFVTLTRPKTAEEVTDETGRKYLKALPAHLAVDDLLGVRGKYVKRRDRGGAWRRFGHHARGWLLGGVRSLEITARKAGTYVGRHRVVVPGAHAHLHCLLEVRGGTTADDVRRAWALACPGVAARAIDVQEVDDDNVYQVGNYCMETRKLLDMCKVDRAYVRDVLSALHGRRLVAAFGAWKKFDLGLREPKGDLVFGDRCVWTLTSSYDEQAPLVRWADGAVEDLADVRLRFLAGPAAPIGGEAPAPGDEVVVAGQEVRHEKVPGGLSEPRETPNQPAWRARDGPLPARANGQ